MAVETLIKRAIPEISDEVNLSDEEADEIHSLLEIRSTSVVRKVKSGYQCNFSAEALVVTPGSPGNSSYKYYDVSSTSDKNSIKDRDVPCLNGSRRKLLLIWLPL